MLPDWNANGVLPPGIHEAVWAEVAERFGGTTHRQELLQGLREALDVLRDAGCVRAFLDGSFVTRAVPNDFDLCWETDGVDWEALPPALLDVDPPRALQQAVYRGDILPNVQESGSGMPILEFFQKDKVTGGAKGIVAIDLSKEVTQ
jgi:hypothetical protein